MQPILLDRYEGLLAQRGAGAARMAETVLASSERHVVHYVPFEHVNASARLVLVGITPGPAQIGLAYDAVRAALAKGLSTAEVLAEAKREAAFGGPTMRPNLVRMLEAFGFPKILGIGAAEDLWGSAAIMMHATSVVPHAAFENGKPFAGSFEDVLASAPLRAMFEDHFLPSLAPLREDALFVALGPTPLAALERCVDLGFLDPDRILGSFAHPSSSGGSQVAVYLGERDVDDLNEGDPVRHRARSLHDAAVRMGQATTRLGGGPLRGVPAAPEEAIHRARKSSVAPTSRAAPVAAEASGEVDVAAIVSAGFAQAGGTTKVLLFRHVSDGREVYAVRGTAKRKLVLHPGDAADADRALPGTGGVFEGLYHNENMRRFPARVNGGKGPVRYGLGYSFATADGVAGFLRRLSRR